MKKLIFILPIFFLGCSTISLVSSWKNPEIVLFDAYKVLIVGLTPEEDIREDFETKMQAEFESRGIESMRSIDLFDVEFTSSEKSEEELNDFEQLLLDKDFDAILFTKVLGSESKETFGKKIDNWASALYGTFQEDYLSNQKVYYDEEYRKEFMVYNLETSLYCICVDKERELIWRGTIDVVDRKNVRRAVNNYIDLVVTTLQEQDLIFRNLLNGNQEVGM